eukprot:CAMPEP_0183358008 /NCGR_PEP_ID=MMETSP0164_2-20130417/47970_1 /TAXON_ID=221442 /ORGANISM="Coccolithus pelagicus ssp braarudi, Strain PLY182g" /LENGTH=68 /DNA_ID=CAMNT_0025531799 /DNA_START=100 /DNA_END=309 /DNA_ORIENTATION=+
MNVVIFMQESMQVETQQAATQHLGGETINTVKRLFLEEITTRGGNPQSTCIVSGHGCQDMPSLQNNAV